MLALMIVCDINKVSICFSSDTEVDQLRAESFQGCRENDRNGCSASEPEQGLGNFRRVHLHVVGGDGILKVAQRLFEVLL